MGETPSSVHIDPASLVDAELLPALQVLPDLSDLSAETLAGWRARIDPPREEVGDDSNVGVEKLAIPGLNAGDPPIEALLYRPHSVEGTAAVVLSLHGGGYVLGSAERDHPINANLAYDLGCAVLSINYRRAPEHPYPAALIDCYAALAWLHRETKSLNIDAARIGVRGLSAGGGLGAGLALMARDRGEYPIRHLALVYPMLDDRTRQGRFTGRFVWTEAANRFGWKAYLGKDLSPQELGYAAPGRAKDLRGLPPTFIAVGSIDLFCAENFSFAAALVDAGVKTEFHVYPGAYHGFDLLAHTALAQSFTRDLNGAIAREWALA